MHLSSKRIQEFHQRKLTSLPVITRTGFGHIDPKFVLPIGVATDSAHPFAITISVEGDRLIATILYSDSQTEFFLKEIDVQIEFVRDPTTKKVTEFLMTQDGAQKRVTRD